MISPKAEPQMDYDDYIESVKRYTCALKSALVNKLERYSGLDCLLQDELLYIDGLELKFELTINGGEPLEQTSGLPDIYYAIKLNSNREWLNINFLEIFYDPEASIHSVMLTGPFTNLLNFKKYIYYHSNNLSYIGLYNFKDSPFPALLAEDIINQLAWKSCGIYRLFLRSQDEEFRTWLEGELERREFINRFERYGFEVNGGRPCCSSLERGQYRHRPFPGKDLLLGVDSVEVVPGTYDKESDSFYRLDNGERFDYYDYWTYKESALMDDYLKQYSLEEYRRYLLLTLD